VKTRLAAASVHFLGSAFIISLFLSVVYFIWYPSPFDTMHAVFDAVKIILVVDLLLGPFLTFVVFNVKKPRSELMRDLCIIFLIQVSAFIWGIHITYDMRPGFLVFQGDTFYSVINKDIDSGKLNENSALPAIWQQPKLVYIEPLTGGAGVKFMENNLGNGGGGLFNSTEKYQPLGKEKDNTFLKDVVNHTISTSILLRSEINKLAIEQFLQSHGGVIEDYLFYPVENGNEYVGVIIFDQSDFSMVGVFD
jgi:hypothetical protein